MELVDGTSLAELLHREGPLEWTRALRIMAALCESLGEAHELGVVHRDLRPGNVLVEQRAGHRDVVKVVDFGLAKLLSANPQLSPVGETVGSIEFSSPEQLQRHPIDGRTDLYALGILGYLMMTGRHPYADARSYGDMIAAHIQRVPPPPSAVRAGLPQDADVILSRCLAKSPDQRYPNAATLAAIIRLALSAHPSDQAVTFEEPRPPIGEEDTALGPMPDRED